jgi:hypothetical protein
MHPAPATFRYDLTEEIACAHIGMPLPNISAPQA